MKSGGCKDDCAKKHVEESDDQKIPRGSNGEDDWLGGDGEDPRAIGSYETQIKDFDFNVSKASCLVLNQRKRKIAEEDKLKAEKERTKIKVEVFFDDVGPIEDAELIVDAEPIMDVEQEPELEQEDKACLVASQEQESATGSAFASADDYSDDDFVLHGDKTDGVNEGSDLESNKGKSMVKETQTRQTAKGNENDDDTIRKLMESNATVQRDPVTCSLKYFNVVFERVSVEGKRIRCVKCSATVRTHKATKDHVENVHSDAFVCHYCGENQPSSFQLSQHVLLMHPPKNPIPVIYCPICDKPFYSGVQVTMERHKLTHYSEQDRKEAEKSGEQVVGLKYSKGPGGGQCETCRKTFKHKYSLKEHTRRKHLQGSGDAHSKKCICPHCGKSYGQDYLEKHIQRFHSNIDVGKLKPFVCPVCDKRFYNYNLLERHKPAHTGERPYVCDLCGEGFTSHVYLKHHRSKEHQKVALFPCPKCPKDHFKSRYHLNRHIESMHMGKINHRYTTKCVRNW